MTMPEVLRNAADLLVGPQDAIGLLAVTPPAGLTGAVHGPPTGPTVIAQAFPSGIVGQDRTRWCWAAVIHTLLLEAGGAPPPQCSIAETHLRAKGMLSLAASCCPPSTSPATDACNRTADLAAAIETNRLPEVKARNCAASDWPTLRSALARSSVPCRIFTGAFNHYSLIGPRTRRLPNGDFTIDFLDPWLPTRSSFDVDTLCFAPEGTLRVVDQLYLPP